MNVTDIIEELELRAVMSSEMAGATPEDGRLDMLAAGVLRKMQRALTPFAEAAEKADRSSDEQKRLLGSELASNASPGWGIKRYHVDAAREILWENTQEVAGEALPPSIGSRPEF